MNVTKITSIIFILHINLAICQTYIISGKIVDPESLIGLEYANVMVLNNEIGTSADKSGKFQLKVNEYLLDDTLVISYIGYYPLKICVKDLPSKPIKLTQQLIKISEVVIKSDKKRKKKEIEINPIKKSKSFIRYAPIYCNDSTSKIQILHVPFCPKNQPSIEAVYIPYNSNPEVIKRMKEVHVYVLSYLDSSLFRLRIYKSKKDTTPGGDLLQIPLYNYVNKGDHLIKIDIEKYGLQMPQYGIFVGVEKLVKPENKYLYDVGGFKAEYYSPMLYHVRSDEAGFTWLYRAGKWQKDNHLRPEQSIDEKGQDVIIPDHYYKITKPAISLTLVE